MTIDEAIKHAEEVAEEKENEGKLLCQSEGASIGCLTCAEEHRQLAEWLKDYKRLLEQEPKWIPVSESPKELGTYLIQTDGEPYMCQCRWTDVNPFWTDFKTKPHWNIFDLPQYSKVIAWMPLPPCFEPQESEVNK